MKSIFHPSESAQSFSNPGGNVLPEVTRMLEVSYSFTKRQNLESSNLKKYANDDFKLDGNGRHFSKLFEITVGKGEITRYEQFLLFPQ